MIITSRTERSIGDVKVALIGERIDGEVQIRCLPSDERYLPLCSVVETSWRYSPFKFIKSVLEKHGQSFEGSVSFAYYDDYPDELEQGVTIDYLGQEQVVSEELFRSLAAAVAGFYLQVVDEMHLPSDADRETLRTLAAALL